MGKNTLFFPISKNNYQKPHEKQEKLIQKKLLCYNKLSQKTRFQSVPIAALRLYDIQRENLVFKKSLCLFSTGQYQSTEEVSEIFYSQI